MGGNGGGGGGLVLAITPSTNAEELPTEYQEPVVEYLAGQIE